MTKRRIAMVSLSLLGVVGMVIGITLASGLFTPHLAVEAQEGGQGGRNIIFTSFSSDADQLRQAIEVLNSNPSPDAAEEAINHGMAAMMGLRPLPTKMSNGDLTEQTVLAHQDFNNREQMFAGALEKYTSRGGKNAEMKGLALNAKQLVEEMNQMANNLANITLECGPPTFILEEGADNFGNLCSQLQPLMDTSTGLELEPAFSPGDGVFGNQNNTIRPIGPLAASYSTNLRADIIPPRWSRDIPENVQVTEALASGECAVVFKEFRGLLLQLHLERVTDVRDPSNKSGLAGSTSEPVWNLQWMPAQYGKQWIMCNKGSGSDPQVETKVTRQIVEDDGLIYFWRFYE